MFYPAGFWENLGKLFLGAAAYTSPFIEKNAAAAGSSGVQRHDIFRHKIPPFRRCGDKTCLYNLHYWKRGGNATGSCEIERMCVRMMITLCPYGKRPDSDPSTVPACDRAAQRTVQERTVTALLKTAKNSLISY